MEMFQYETSWKDQFPVGSAIFTKTAVVGSFRNQQSPALCLKQQTAFKKTRVLYDIQMCVHTSMFLFQTKGWPVDL